VKRCDAPTCRKFVPVGRLMCPTHWYRVSADTRARVWNAWRAIGEKLQGADPDKLQVYLAAVDRAKMEAAA